MIIGIPKEIKNNESRVAATPGGVAEMVYRGHQVFVETCAGLGSGFPDEAYSQAGATILTTAGEVFEKADLIYKVKEPIAQEYDLLRENQILFTYLHLAPDLPQTEALLRQKVIGIAYETVELPDRSLPLLTPMSEVAGRMSVQVGANLLQAPNGGSGTLLGGVPGVAPGEVVVVGAGNVGYNAARMAVGLGAHVTMLDINKARLNQIDELSDGRIATLFSNRHNLMESISRADLLIGGVLVPGAKAPKVVTTEMVKGMKPGSVIVDVAIDQGGCVETIDRITTHDNPSYEMYGVVHYSVANMPGAVPHTSTMALSGCTLPYLLRIADLGAEEAMRRSPALKAGLNVYKGVVTYQAVAEGFGMEYVSADTVLA